MLKVAAECRDTSVTALLVDAAAKAWHRIATGEARSVVKVPCTASHVGVRWGQRSSVFLGYGMQ
jgi:hypothetical protein